MLQSNIRDCLYTIRKGRFVLIFILITPDRLEIEDYMEAARNQENERKRVVCDHPDMDRFRSRGVSCQMKHHTSYRQSDEAYCHQNRNKPSLIETSLFHIISFFKLRQCEQ
jgi:hypothetical protein